MYALRESCECVTHDDFEIVVTKVLQKHSEKEYVYQNVLEINLKLQYIKSIF